MPERLVETLLYLHKQLERAAQDCDASISDYFLLHFIREAPRRASDFTAATRLGKPGVSATVSRLENRRWIERLPDSSDGRAQTIRITPAGRQAARAFERAMRAELEAFLGVEAVARAEGLIEPLYELWNDKRIARFNRLRRGGPAGDEGSARVQVPR